MNAHDELMFLRGSEVRDMTTGAHKGQRGVDFRNDPVLGWRDIAAACEQTDSMRVGPHTGSFLALSVMDPTWDGAEHPDFPMGRLVAAMTIGAPDA